MAGPHKAEGRLQYQVLEENYELLGTHKTEHYPTNFRGVHSAVTVPLGPATAKALLYLLRQIDVSTHAGDTIFGDSYFPSVAGSAQGDILAWRLGGEYDFSRRREGLPKAAAYLEQARFRKDAPDTAENDIDKAVTNLSLLVTQPVAGGWSVEAGYRLVSATGRWQAMRFHHRQGIPELAVSYRRREQDKDRLRCTAMYQRYDFVDSIAASAGANNYEAHQLLVEVYAAF